jgi:hypothetical protein
MDLHAGIAMDVKTNNYDKIYMWVLQWLEKKLIIITKPICGYYIFEMTLCKL